MDKLIEVIKSVQYGEVKVSIRDGHIIAIEKTEKIKP